MLDVLEVQNQLKNFSQEQLVKEMQMPTGNVPQFLVLSELNRRRTMSQDLAKRQSADQPTVKEEVVASSGMPMENVSMMAQQMAPKTSMTENTGIASMMPRELPSEEEPMKMSYGGMLMGSRMMGLSRAAAPLARDVMRPAVIEEDRRFPFPAMQGRFSSGLNNLGRDISGRVQNRTQEEVDDFIGEVDNMAQERFEVNLSEPSQRQRDMQSFLSGKGQPQPRMAMKDGGAIKAKNGMFADIGRAIGNIDNTTGLSNPLTLSPPDTKLFASSMQPSGVTSFAGVYNFIKTNFPNMSDAEARRQATEIVKTQQEGDIPRLDVTVNKGLPAPDQKLFAGSLGTDPTYDQFKIKPQQYTPPSSDGVSGGVDFDATAPNISPVESGLGSLTTDISDMVSPELDKINVGSGISGTDSPPSENPYAAEIQKAKELGIGERAKRIDDYLLKDKFAEKEAERRMADIFKSGRGDSSRPFMSGTDLESYKEIFKDGRTSPFEAEERKNKQIMENFTGGEEMDKLVEKIEKDEEKKKKKDKDSDSGGLGGLGGASGALSELSAQIAELKEKREKGRDSEKWFSLAKLGLGMLASASPTVFGALGEGGLKALEDFKAGKKAYDDDILGYLKVQASIEKTKGDQAVKSAYYKGVLENAKKKGLTGLTSKEALASRDRQLSRRADLIKDPTILMDYNNFIASGGKEPASGAVLELLRLDANIKKLENMLGSGFATVELDTVN